VVPSHQDLGHAFRLDAQQEYSHAKPHFELTMGAFILTVYLKMEQFTSSLYVVT
jgi:hypothetical protein